MLVLSLSTFKRNIGYCANLGFVDAERKDMSKIINVLQRYVDDYIREAVDHMNFHHWVQQPDETFDGFLILLRDLIKICKFCS